MRQFLGLVCVVLAVSAAPAFADEPLPSRSFAGIVQAQTVPDANNPNAVEWIASLDHAAITSYEIDILRPDGSVLQTLNLGKPAPDAQNVCAASLNVQPIAFGAGYSLRMRAKAGTAVSVDTISINKFNRIPGGPSRVIAK